MPKHQRIAGTATCHMIDVSSDNIINYFSSCYLCCWLFYLDAIYFYRFFVISVYLCLLLWLCLNLCLLVVAMVTYSNYTRNKALHYKYVLCSCVSISHLLRTVYLKLIIIISPAMYPIAGGVYSKKKL